MCFLDDGIRPRHKIVNVAQLREFVKGEYFARRLSFSTNDLSLTEVATGQILRDESDLCGVPGVVRVSTYISDAGSGLQSHFFYFFGN